MDENHVDEAYYDDEDEDDAEPMAVLATYATEEAATADARTLVEHGVGAHVLPVPPRDPSDADDAGDAGDRDDAAFQIEVLPIDVIRGERVLGIAEHDLGYDPANPPKLEKGPTPWKTLLIIWALAMVIVPVLAFLITWKLAGQ